MNKIKSSKCHQDSQGAGPWGWTTELEHAFNGSEKLKEVGLSRPEKDYGGPCDFLQLPVEGHREGITRLLLEVLGEMMRVMRQKLEDDKFQLAIRELFFHPEGGRTLTQVAQRG